MKKVMKAKDVKEVAERVKERIEKLLTKKKFVVLSVPGGRSIQGLFSELKKKDLPWENIHVFMVDERLVPIEDDHSNFKHVKKLLFGDIVKKGKMPKNNLHPFIMDMAKEKHGTKRYELELKKFGGNFDIAILGVGEDGHIGGLYPHTSINNDDEYFFTLFDSPKPPKERMTSSRKLLLKTEFAVFLFIGEGKEEAYKKFLDSTVSVDECPAKLAYKIKESIVLRKGDYA